MQLQKQTFLEVTAFFIPLTHINQCSLFSKTFDLYKWQKKRNFVNLIVTV
jgi:hypothetical protein